MVHFVGAGSGAVDLITVRGARLLQEADVIVYAGSLVNPEMVIGVPVGFVNVVEAKEEVIKTIPNYIVARGRKGGSNVAAAIVNAALYQMITREGI